MNETNFSLTDDLELVAADGLAIARLSPGEALDFAEDLIRRGTRRMMLEEADRLANHRSNEMGVN